MTTGLPRREGPQDSLAGQQDMQPVTLRGPGVSAPQGFRLPDNTASKRVADQLSRWGSGILDRAVNKQQQKDVLDGQMAYQQGKTLDSVKTEGNKFALEGYRMMDAQTISSSMLAAQRQGIAMSGHALSPEEFRAQYVNRLDAQLENVDPRVADLVREQMAAQMPTLVADHTAQHIAYKEGKNYESLERTIDVISRDPTATDALIDFAKGGEDSASAGLSDDRRRSAVVSGVIRAFENDNPLAFSALAGAGLLGDNLTTDQIGQIRAARKAFEGRRKSEYNEALFNGEQALMAKVESGALTPTQAVEALSTLYADHDISMTSAEAGAIYSGAKQGQQTARLTRGQLLDEAGARGDRAAQANIIMDSLITTESSGRAGAFRTNTDGRSFGGLVQMGQARLNEVTAMLGRGSMSVEQYTALPAAQQRAIAQRHFIDLIEAAEATGAVGSTINGVTVTLSGLVAVGHLGGKGGMRKFVKSGGSYNPADQLGTSLTDYLKKHGSGQMQEFMSPENRLNWARQRNEETRQRLAMDAYEEIAPRLAEVDDAFGRGELDRGAWQERRENLYARYNQERTRADVNHEIGVIRSVDENQRRVAKAASDEAYAIELERAEASLVPDRVAWERVINNPESSPQQVQEANAAYTAARQNVFDNAGIRILDRDNGSAAETMITKTVEAMDRHRVHSQEGAEIANATAMGYLSDLPKHMQERAFKEAQDRIIQGAQEGVATGSMTEEDANVQIAQQMNEFIASAGVADPKIMRQMSAVMRGPMIDRDGNPNPGMVDVVEQYASIKAMNPHAATTYLNEAATIRAEAILSRAESPNLIGEAVRTLGLESKENPLRQPTDEYMARPDVIAEVDAAVDDYIDTRDIGILHAFWQADAMMDQVRDNTSRSRENMQSPETREKITGEVVNALTRLQKITPQFKAAELVNKAVEDVQRRTELVGGNPVMLSPGQDIRRNFFGDRAGDFMHDGAINSATMEWLRSDEAREQYPELDDTTFWEAQPAWLQSIVGGVVNPLGGNFDPAMSRGDAWDTGNAGVRPFTAYGMGENVVIQYLRPNGSYSDPIVIPSRRAGEMYMQRRIKEMAE